MSYLSRKKVVGEIVKKNNSREKGHKGPNKAIFSSKEVFIIT